MPSMLHPLEQCDGPPCNCCPGHHRHVARLCGLTRWCLMNATASVMDQLVTVRHDRGIHDAVTMAGKKGWSFPALI
eukprot:3978958-Amphidinium_carterae.2